MKVGNIVVLLACMFLFISCALVFAETCSPTLLGAAGSEPYPACVAVSGNYAYMTMEGGLVVFDVSNPRNPTIIARYLIGDSATEISISGSMLYMASWVSGLYILDISNPASPTLLGRFNPPGLFRWYPPYYFKAGTGLYVLGTTAYMSAGTGGLYIIDVSNPASPTLLGSYNAYPGSAEGVYVLGGTAYLTIRSLYPYYINAPESWTGLLVIDVSNPATPILLGSYSMPENAIKVQVSGTIAYVTEQGKRSDGWNGLTIIDVSNSASPQLLGNFNMGTAQGIYISGKTAYVAGGSGGLMIIDVSNPASPKLLGSYNDVLGNTVSVYVIGGIAYSPRWAERGALRLIDVSCCTVNESDSPATVAVISPAPNASGWNNADVTINLTATDSEGGSGIKELHYELTGAVNEEKTISDSMVEIPMHTEGVTILSYYAVDNSGNVEVAKTQEIKIDKTRPVIVSQVSPQPNPDGWNNSDVTVTFTAYDSFSGIAAVSEPVTVTTESKDQMIGGEAIDLAGNRATTSVTLNIDKTPPQVSIGTNPNLLWPPNHKMVSVAIVGQATDSLSGIGQASFEVQDEYGKVEPTIPKFGDITQLEAWRNGTDKDGRVYIISAGVKDAAGNISSASTTVTCPHDRGK